MMILKKFDGGPSWSGSAKDLKRQKLFGPKSAGPRQPRYMWTLGSLAAPRRSSLRSEFSAALWAIMYSQFVAALGLHSAFENHNE